MPAHPITAPLGRSAAEPPPDAAGDGGLLSAAAANVTRALVKAAGRGRSIATSRPSGISRQSIPILKRPRPTSSLGSGVLVSLPFPSRGYATRAAPGVRLGQPIAAASRRRAASSASSASNVGGSLSKTDLKFLDDPHMSIQDKLFLFMQKVLEKTDKELTDQMKAMEAKKSSSSSRSSATSGSSNSTSSSSSSKSGGGLLGFLKSVFPPLGLAEDVMGDKLVNQLLSQISGALMGSLATAVGLPALAPAAMALGSKLGGEISGAVRSNGGERAFASSSSGVSGSSGSSSSSSASGSGEYDERLEAMKLERLVQKQNQLFSTISNIMKSNHDATMTAANNLR